MIFFVIYNFQNRYLNTHLCVNKKPVIMKKYIFVFSLSLLTLTAAAQKKKKTQIPPSKEVSTKCYQYEQIQDILTKTDVYYDGMND